MTRVARLGVALLLGSSLALAAPVVGPPTQDSNGVLHYPVTSSFQSSQPNDLRVLLPASPGAGQRRFLYALPVEVGTASSFGDPVETIRLLGVSGALHLVLVVPSFSQLPWYADHPSDLTVRQESYLVDDLVPAVEALYPETPANPGPPRRLLIGFSKSGVGALSLLLRHGKLFDAAAAWDAPLAKQDVSQLPGALAIFGTQASYATYAIPSALPAHAAELQGPARIWLGGWSGWHADMIAAHDQMTNLGIAHAWVDGPQVAHRWDSGWVQGAIEFLDQAAPALALGIDAGTDAGEEAGASDAGSDASGASDAAADAGPDAGAVDAGVKSPAGSAGSGEGCACASAGPGPGDPALLLFIALVGANAVAVRRAMGFRRPAPRARRQARAPNYERVAS